VGKVKFYFEMNKINPGEIDRLSADGREWFKKATDPMHDNALRLVGYPDERTGDSVVIHRRVSAPLAKPSGLTAGHTYEAMVCNWPFSIFDENYGTEPCPGSNAATDGYGHEIVIHYSDEGVGNAGQVFGDVGIYTIDSTEEGGAVIPQGTAVWTPTNYSSSKIPYFPYFFQHYNARVIALGIEVTNTTPEIYKSGSLAVASIDEDYCLSRRYVVKMAAGAIVSSYSSQSHVRMIASAPRTFAECTAIPNSRVWEAKDGAYVVPTISELELLPRKPTSEMVIASYTSNYGQDGSENFGMITPMHVFAVDANENSVPMPACNIPVDRNMSVIFLSGLNENSTFTVTVDVTIECFVSPQDSRILDARPSSQWDEAALTLFSKVMNVMPAGVKVGDNASGDWWRSVLKALKLVAPYAGAFLSDTFPLAGAVAKGISKISVNRGNQPKDERKASKKKKNRK